MDQKGPSRSTTTNLRSSHKLEVPMFERDDFHWWMMQAECFFEVKATSPQIKVKVAVSQLRGRAL